MSPYGMRMGALREAATENLIKYVSVQKDITILARRTVAF
jgi:hypothetical protein